MTLYFSLIILIVVAACFMDWLNILKISLSTVFGAGLIALTFGAVSFSISANGSLKTGLEEDSSNEVVFSYAGWVGKAWDVI